MKASELELKILQMLDGELPAEEVAVLEAQLLADVKSREIYWKLARLHSSLETRYESHATIANTNIVPIDRIIARQRKRTIRFALSAAAVIALVSAIVLSLSKIPESPIASFRTEPDSVFSLTHEGEGNAPFEGNALAVGSRLRLTSGTVEAIFESGVRVVLEGACDLLVLEENRVALDQGMAWFEVPEAAVGFAVETEELIVVDLGTEFGLVASPTESDEVHVSKGSVEVEVRGRDDPAQKLVAEQACRLSASGELLVTASSPFRFKTTLRRSARTVPVAGWVSIFDPQSNEPRFIGATAATASPVTSDAHQDCIAASFAPVTLADGDSITLRGKVSFDVALTGSQFRVGLFNGAAPAQDVGNPYVGIYSEAPTTSPTDLEYGSGTHEDHPFVLGTKVSAGILPGGDGVGAETPIEFSLSITRNGSMLDVATSYTAGSSYDRAGKVNSLDILSTAPGFDYTFNIAGILMGDEMQVGRARFSNISITVSR